MRTLFPRFEAALAQVPKPRSLFPRFEAALAALRESQAQAFLRRKEPRVTELARALRLTMNEPHQDCGDIGEDVEELVNAILGPPEEGR